MIIPITISSIAVLFTLKYASIFDVKDRKVPFKIWWPLILIGSAMTVWFYYSQIFKIAIIIAVLTASLCLIFYISSAYLNIFGGADAWALIFISVFVPVHPITGAIMFPFIVFLSSCLFHFMTPLLILTKNKRDKNKGTLKEMLTQSPDKSGQWKPYKVPFVVTISLGFIAALIFGVI